MIKSTCRLDEAAFSISFASINTENRHSRAAKHLSGIFNEYSINK